MPHPLHSPQAGCPGAGAQADLRAPLADAAIHALLLSALALAGLISICVGQYAIPPEKVIAILASGAGGGVPTWTPLDERIVTLVRGPRTLLVMLCGAGLSLAGAAMQATFRNPLAAPELLGVSSGAAFGGALSILLGAPALMLLGASFGMGLLALILVGLIARIGGRPDSATVILGGVIVGAFFAALVSLTQFYADPDESLPAIVFWLLGSFAAANWQQLYICAPGIIMGCGILFQMRFRLNVLSLGDEDARSLGIPVERDRWLVFAAVAMISGAVVSVAGMIGWVGLVVPHLARLMVGPDNRRVFPVTCMLGATYLTLIDALARTASTAEIPLGALTAIIGAPFVAVLLRRARQTAEEKK